MKKKFILSALLTNIMITQSINAMNINNKIHAWIKSDNYLILSIPVKIDRLDPIKSLNAHSKFSLPLIYEPLVNNNSDQELEPALAEAWEIADNNRSIILRIKKNHHFSDSTEVTAKDVINSIYRLCGFGSQTYGQLRGLLGCEDHARGKPINPKIFLLDNYTVKFNINSSPTTFLYQLSSPSTVITKKLSKKLIGSGPYKIAENSGNYLILNKNKYYNGNIKINNNGVILIHTDGHKLIEQINHYKLDGAILYEMAVLNHFNNKNYKLIRTNPNITNILVLNNQKYPFNNPEVRKALTADIYNHINIACIPGAHKAYGIIPVGIGGSLANAIPEILPEITPSKLFTKIPSLKQKSISITIHQLIDLRNNCASQQIIQTAKKFNIDIKFKYHQDYSDLLPHYTDHTLDGFLEFYVFNNREAYNIFQFFAKNEGNHANLKNDNIDKMLEKAISTTSSHDRFKIYHQLAEYIQNNNIAIPLFYIDHGNIMSKCLAGIPQDFIFNPLNYIPQLYKIKNCNI